MQEIGERVGRGDGKVALVSGGAGGIGSAICRRLSREGVALVITYNHGRERAEKLAAELSADNLVLHAPVDDSSALRRAAEAVAGRYGRLDILVNNAAITEPVPHANLDSLTDELVDRIFRVNVRGALASVRAFRSLMSRARNDADAETTIAGDTAVIINISSIAARTAVGSNIAYCASKAALDNMTMSLARALAPEIRVVGVAPGWVNGDYARRMPAGVIDEQRGRTPLGRIAEAEDVANAVAAAAFELTFTTGSIIPVDGGRELG